VANAGFPGTGSWDTWQTATATVALNPGANTVRATATTANGGPNVDALAVDVGASRVVAVSSIAQLQAAADNALPGDLIELADGVYPTAGPVRLTRSGTASAPITVAAQHLGRVEIGGTDGFAFGAVSSVVVAGFRLTHANGVTIPAGTSHVRLSRNVIQLSSGSTTNWATVVGDDAEVDHNTFQHKSTVGVFLQITGPGSTAMAQRAWVHHNYFLDHSFGGSNGGESIRLGFSYRQLSSAHAVVEYNLFERADGDSEAISVKSSDNTIRFNTIRDSRGSIVLRHGNRNLVEGNLMLGGSAGIRFYENDHVVVNNLIQGGTGQIIAGSGTVVDDTTNGTEHARADRVVVAFNTVAGSATPLVDVGPGSDPYGPDGCTFADNILVGGGSGALVSINNGTNLRWEGNIVWAGTGGNMPSSGYRLVNPALVTDAGGLYRLPGTSPAVDTATGSYPQVTRDMDGQPRSGAKDVGADEYAASGPTRRPLTTADVGPSAP
jgi:parallel beta-helix repeat protein